MQSSAAPLLPDVRLPAGRHSRQLERRLGFLWRAALAARAAPALAHRLSASLLRLARANRAALPAEVLDFVCERCAALLLPTLSASVRVAPQPLDSAANRRLQRQRRVARRSQTAGLPAERIKCALRVTCSQCGHANVRAAATVVNKPKSKKPKKRAREEEDADQPAAKRVKPHGIGGETGSKAGLTLSKQEDKPLLPTVRNVLAPPPSPPRKLLDAKRKKKKKNAGADGSTAAKSSLNSFLQGLRPGTSK